LRSKPPTERYKEVLGDVEVITWDMQAATTPAGVTVRVRSAAFAMKAQGPDVITLTIELAGDVAIGVLSAWLYDRLSKRGHGRITALRTRRRRVTRVTPEIVEQLIEEERSAE
jgi:hypothetical protein